MTCLGKKERWYSMSVMAIQALHNEVGQIARHSIHEGRDHLDNLEIEHLIKMTDDVVMKIKKQLGGYCD